MRISLFYLIVLVFIISCTNVVKPTNSDPTASIEEFLDLSFTEAERDSFQDELSSMKNSIRNLHKYQIENSVIPAILFNPIPKGFMWNKEEKNSNWEIFAESERPENLEDLAFATVAQLSGLIRSRKVSSEELTKMYLSRLKKYGDSLQCIVTLTEELALEQARKADAEIAAGNYKGPLHGIPYGIKDLLTLEGYKTTWGAMPYKDQQLEGTATVVKKLEAAGAVLCAKLTLGALAMGDVWFGGVTKNPWNLNQGSSGSSAGSASATAAGLVAFTIGTETWGSIVSPSTRCGVTGLRPTYGRVSRYGAMALSWSMDKIGPICRSAQDCAIVFDVIHGTDPKDPTLYEAPFNFDANSDVKKFRVAYAKSLFDSARFRTNDSISLSIIRNMGFEPEIVSFDTDIPIEDLAIILSAEAGAAFDELTRSNKDDLLKRQDKNAWPTIFRASRFIPATEYINANRIRTLLIEEMHQIFSQYDVIVVPSFGGSQLLMTNLTGHPCVVVPNGFNRNGSPTSISFIGNLFEEGKLLEFAHAFQKVSDFDEAHPSLW